MAEQKTDPPLVRAIHADPDCRTLDIEPLPETARRPHGSKSPAKWAYERLILYIKNFEDQLDGDHEVAMGFIGSDAGLLRIEGIGYFDPDIVTFSGVDADGTRTQLIQHVSQLNVILRALRAEPEAMEARRIGFRLAQELDEGGA